MVRVDALAGGRARGGRMLGVRGSGQRRRRAGADGAERYLGGWSEWVRVTWVMHSVELVQVEGVGEVTGGTVGVREEEPHEPSHLLHHR